MRRRWRGLCLADDFGNSPCGRSSRKAYPGSAELAEHVSEVISNVEDLKEIIAGKASVDRVVEKDGKRFLRAATIVPVVMTKCVSCHPPYAKVPKGQAIGALVYTLPVE